MDRSDAWEVAITGAGAAGLLAAIFAGRSGARVLLLETRSRPGAKIRVSGGGRCNILPSIAALDDFHTSGSRHALRNVLFSWPLREVRDFFEGELSIPLKTEATGKVFPKSDDPGEVVGALLRECGRAGAALREDRRVIEARRLEDAASGRFELRCESGESIRCRRLILATGGLSLPKTGSDGGGFAIAASLGHAPAPVYPALVPLLTGDDRWRGLAGVSARAVLRAVRGGRVLEERQGDLLFTHRGFSGPVVLDMSHYLTAPQHAGAELRAAWRGGLEGTWEAALREGGPGSAAAVLGRGLPRRLAEALLACAGVPAARRAGEITREERLRLLAVLEDFPLPASGNEGYRTAEVTGGGVPLEDLHLATLESRRVPGLHFAGEILDADGCIGGYNFLWAWVTGRKAGLAAAAAAVEERAGRGPG